MKIDLGKITVKVNLFTIIKVIRIIRKYLKDQKMCFKKWFSSSDPVPLTGDKIALLFGINDYYGSANDLSGCINDVEDVKQDLNRRFPGFTIRLFRDSGVTTQKFVSEIEAVIEYAKAKTERIFLYLHYSGHGTQIPDNSGQEQNRFHEALYLYNGPLIDDVIYELQQKSPDNLTVVVKLDCCFSGNFGSRKMNPHMVKNRFMPLPGLPEFKKPVNRFAKTDSWQKWLFISGCGEEQTSADSFFNNRANGAFTYYDLKSFDEYTIYSGEVMRCKNFLVANSFDQVPEISGPADLIDRIVLKNV